MSIKKVEKIWPLSQAKLTREGSQQINMFILEDRLLEIYEDREIERLELTTESLVL